MEIENPRRILAVSQPEDGLLDFVEGLTGSRPPLNNDSVAGTSHDWAIKTSYYTTTIPIWLDEITSPSSWSTEFLIPEAKEVLQALGAFVVCFRKPLDQPSFDQIRSLLKHVSEVAKEGCGLTWDGVCLAIAMPQSNTPQLSKSFDDWEGVCQEFGFEFVDFEMKGLNQYMESTGVKRIKEALESNDWEGRDHLESALQFEDLDEDEENEGLGLRVEADQMKIEMLGLNEAIHVVEGNLNENDNTITNHDDEVEKLQAMLLKMQSVRGADLPLIQRKQLAARTVGEIMKKL
ncbi:BgTH12-06890 [Blumeria graminis f. sp. triticale]|uniref:BgTH12-06890 n=1 Tax=Blumeria graminis f. sp. triticale TaxID=1689686 RepID=A0A9W4GII6_BLUGR|nr:BgTH12-06890 [Blumeria graminis f. sp. triticale]